MAVCVIPARGGSKRIPRKNIRQFRGRPMIGWSISAAATSGCFERIVVSTDDAEIASIARDEGAEPLNRPAALADDITPTVPVVAHAVSALRIAAEVPICCLYATAPLVRAGDLRAGLSKLVESDASYVMSVTHFSFPIQRALRRDEHGRVEMMDPDQMTTRSQDLEQAWHDAGQFYWAYADTWSAGTSIFAPGAMGVPLPPHRVQDIDTEADWRRAEALAEVLAGGSAEVD